MISKKLSEMHDHDKSNGLTSTYEFILFVGLNNIRFLSSRVKTNPSLIVDEDSTNLFVGVRNVDVEYE